MSTHLDKISEEIDKFYDAVELLKPWIASHGSVDTRNRFKKIETGEVAGCGKKGYYLSISDRVCILSDFLVLLSERLDTLTPESDSLQIVQIRGILKAIRLMDFYLLRDHCKEVLREKPMSKSEFLRRRAAANKAAKGG